jgi:hypothetical protein
MVSVPTMFCPVAIVNFAVIIWTGGFFQNFFSQVHGVI